MDTLITRSKIEKAFLFDVISKIYIASDSKAVNLNHYEICSELIDVLIDVTCMAQIMKVEDQNSTKSRAQ